MQTDRFSHPVCLDKPARGDYRNKKAGAFFLLRLMLNVDELGLYFG